MRKTVLFIDYSVTSERRTDGKLEFFALVAELAPRLLLVAQWIGVRKAEQAHGREPLQGDTRRHAQLRQVERVLDAVAALVAECRIAQVERLARVDEQAEAGGARELRTE